MDERPHKTHRPAQTGVKAAKKVKARGKDKQNRSNEKVHIRWTNGELWCNVCDAYRPLPRNLADRQTAKLGETSSAIKLVYMSPLWIGPRTMSHHQ
jgi:hypothetical protein